MQLNSRRERQRGADKVVDKFLKYEGEGVMTMMVMLDIWIRETSIHSRGGEDE